MRLSAVAASVVIVLVGAITVGARPAGASSVAAAPANDNFADAVPIGGIVGVASGTNVGATNEAGEPDHAGHTAVASVWYRWTAPAGGVTTFDLCTSDFDTVLAVYTGTTLASLTPVAASDDSFDDACGFRASRLELTAAAGTEYRVAVDGYLGETGTFVLHWTPPRPTNLTSPSIAGTPDEGSTLTATTGSWASGLSVAYGYQWQRCGRLDYPGANVARGKPAFGSDEDPDHPAADAVDGDFFTYWSAGDWPPQRITVDLRTPQPLAKLRAAITQLPDGYTEHRVLVKGPQPDAPWLLLTQFAATTTDQQVLEWARAGSWVDGVQFIRVETSTSPSWVGWREIEAYTNCLDVPGATGTSYTVARADIGYMLRMVVTATNAAGATAAASATSEVVPYVLPRNVTPPAVSGEVRIGATLAATTGEWEGTRPLSFKYQWQWCLDQHATTCFDLGGANGAAYTVREDDAGFSLRAVVTASNDAGSAAAASGATTSVAGICRVPAVTGQTLAAARGALVDAGCAAGSVRYAHSARVRKGRVVAQSPGPGTVLAAGAGVGLVVSKGKRPPSRITLCYRGRTVRVTKPVAQRLRKHGARPGRCRPAKRK